MANMFLQLLESENMRVGQLMGTNVDNAIYGACLAALHESNMLLGDYGTAYIIPPSVEARVKDLIIELTFYR
jgi:hypothetical protein